MRGFALYLLAGILVVLAMDMVAPPIGLNLSIAAWPAVAPAEQVVDRAGKGDRLQVSRSVINRHELDQQEPANRPAVLVGCDPVFSPLSVSAQANFAGRCVAELPGIAPFHG